MEFLIVLVISAIIATNGITSKSKDDDVARGSKSC